MKMMKIQLLVLGVSVSALVGCQTTANPDVPQKDGTPKVVNTSTNTVRAVTLKVSEKLRSIRVLTTVSGADDAGKIAASSVESALDDELAQNGFTVVADQKDADVIVQGRVAYSDKTQRGDRMVVRGTASVSMFRKPLKSSVASNAKIGGIISNGAFEARSEESYSAEEALKKLGVALCPDVRKWAKQACVKVAGDIGVCEIALTGLRSPNTVSEGYPTRFATQVNRLNGIYECRVESSEKTPDRMTALVVYEKRLFPDGVLSRLREQKIVKDGQ